MQVFRRVEEWFLPGYGMGGGQGYKERGELIPTNMPCPVRCCQTSFTCLPKMGIWGDEDRLSPALLIELWPGLPLAIPIYNLWPAAATACTLFCQPLILQLQASLPIGSDNTVRMCCLFKNHSNVFPSGCWGCELQTSALPKLCTGELKPQLQGLAFGSDRPEFQR